MRQYDGRLTGGGLPTESIHTQTHTALPDGARPLTEAQSGLWFAQRLDAGNPVFNTAHCTHMEGPLDVAAFQQAVGRAVVEADGLALRVVEHDGAPYLVIDESLRPTLDVVDCTSFDDPWAHAQALMRAEQQTPVDPTRDPLAAEKLFKVGPVHHVWYQRVHHLATDGYGMALLESRVAQHYAALLGGLDAGRPLTSFAAVLDEDAEYRGLVATPGKAADDVSAAGRTPGAKRIADAAFWTALFDEVGPVASLAEGVPVSAHHYVHQGMPLSDEVATRLQALSTVSGVSWPDILVALSAAYVARLTGKSHAVVGAPYMGRLGSASARVPAMVMNILAIPVEVDEQVPLADFLGTTARLLRKARRHGRYRSEQLRRDLGLLGGQRRLYGPLINVLPFDPPVSLTGLRTHTDVLCSGPVDDLTITFRGQSTGEQLRLSIEANPALYSDSAVAEHLARLAAFLHQALSVDSLANVPTLTAAEFELWQEQAWGEKVDVPVTTLTALIEARLADAPHALAVVTDDETLTYSQLDTRTRALADHLARLGVGPGDRVAVALPRGMDQVLALVATLRAGAAYLPLDLDHPRERLDTILNAATPRVLLTHRAWRDHVSHDTVVCLDDMSGDAPVRVPTEEAQIAGVSRDAAPHAASPRDAVRRAAAPADPAYVIYTSGSTGTPKGVVVTHDAIVNRLVWMHTFYGIDHTDRILQKTPATFDVSVWEFFLPLITGATLVVAPPEAHKDPAWLAELIRRHAVTTVHFVPSMLSAFLSEPDAHDVTLKRVFCSGEALPAATRDRFHQVIDAELHNLYGPTEAAVDVSYWPAAADDKTAPVPIGFPVWNTGLYVLDDLKRPTAVDVPGRLYLAGRQLADGYLGQPALTAERFVPDPFGADGARMYDTGDLARRRPDGALVFLGRSDHQIKIRGQRIELEEIETVLAHAPGIGQVAVLVRTDQPGQDRIVAYAVAHEGVDISPDMLRDHAAKRLPDYMVPSAFVMLAALPVTSNGKLDRRALPAPPAGGGSGRAVKTATEREVADWFGQVLDRPAPTGADDDFFDLGGHSLLAAQLAAVIRQARGHAFSLGAVFEHPTVSRLAQHLDALASLPGGDQQQASGAGGFGASLALRQSRSGRPALFCLHPAGGLSWCYGALARSLSPERTVIGIQARGLQPGSSDTPASIEDMARAYVDDIIALQPHGPYHLAGWSVGGIVAQAMAAELQARGLAVGGLIMLDAYPSDCWRDQPEPPADAIYKALLHIAGYDPTELIDLAMTREGVVDFLRRSGHPLGELPDEMIDGVFRVVALNNAMVRDHYHRRYDGHLLFFRAALDHEGENLFPHQWLPHVETLDVHDVPTVHAHMVGAEATAGIAPLVGTYLAERDGVAALEALR